MKTCFFSDQDATTEVLPKRHGYYVEVMGLWKYWIAEQTRFAYDSGSNKLSLKDNYLCLQETIKLNREGLIPFWIVRPEDTAIEEDARVVLRSIEEFKIKTIDHKNKDLKILNLIVQKLSGLLNPFSFTHLNMADRYLIGIFDNNEYAEWINHLIEEDLIVLNISSKINLKNHIESSDYKNQLLHIVLSSDTFGLSISGWELIQKLQSNQNSKKAFIAMAFTDSDQRPCSNELRDTIKNTLERIGWEAQIVDEVEYNDGVMDRVIALINESRFVVAELTHNKAGVYYEAGYAKGLI